MQRHLTSTILNITGARELKEGRFEGWGQAAWTRFLGEFIKFVCKGYRP
jgi:hypothetical protein